MCEIDVLLLNLPCAERIKNVNGMPPLGLLYIGTILKKNGFKVKVLDFIVKSLNKEKFIKILKKYNPKIVGISTYTETWNAQKVLSRIIKKELPDTYLLAGGGFATFCYQDIFKYTSTDFVIRGEGEYSTLSLCNILLNNSSGNIADIDGIVYKKKNGDLFVNSEINRIKKLDLLPFPDRRLVDIQSYSIPFNICTSRGCPGDCIYCSSKAFWGKSVIMRSAENIFDEVKHIYNDYDSDLFFICDDTFTSSRKRVFEFCKLINETAIKFSWGCESRADIVTEDLIIALKEAGCKKIDFGLESGDNAILKKLKKKVTIEQIESAVKLSAENGFKVSVSFMIGHAFDTTETIEKTLNFAKYLQDKYGAFAFGTINTPFPGTEQYRKADELGIKIHSKDWSDFKLNNANISIKNISRDKLRYYFNNVIKIAKSNR